MWNEDTGEEVKCIICGKGYECEHLLALFDQTFGDCKQGYACDHLNEFEGVITSQFIKALSEGKGNDHDWGDDGINEIWSDSILNCDLENSDLDFERGLLFRLIIEMFEQCGGNEYPGLIDDGGGPGNSSSVKLFFADNPKEVLEGAHGALKSKLRQLSHGHN